MRLAATRLAKAFAGVRALDGVDFDVAAGEIHALVGENGAGKSTLVKILGGALRPDAGDVRLDGAPLPLGDPLAVRRRGVSLVYQELALVPHLSVADNVFLGRERGWPCLRRVEMARAVDAVLADLGADIDSAAPAGALSVGHQQIVEIARALATDAKVLILDEPTAALSPAEVARLFAVLRRLRARGLAIVFITHRLDEVLAIADRVTVLRDGRGVASAPAGALDRAQIVRWMVGREVTEARPARRSAPGPPVLEVRGLRSPPAVRDVSLTVRAGEVVGLTGLVGAGRSSAALALVGARRAAGEVRLDGRQVRFRSPAEAMAHGVVYVTEDRRARGLWPFLSVEANLTFAALGRLTRFGLLVPARERATAAEAVRRFGIRAADLRLPVAALSGGNQQKVLLARFLVEPRRLVVLDEPTRGVDVGARAEVHALIDRLAGEGAAVLLVSSDLTEVLALCDPVVVMRDGCTVGTLPRADATPERLMALAATESAA